jgi:aspartate/methionine/tyrosine aminotransferase
LGLAPGEAFAPEARGWLRWCFASRDPQRLVLGVQRLQLWLSQQALPPSDASIETLI